MKPLCKYIIVAIALLATSSLHAQSAEKIKQQTLDSVQKCNSNAFEIIDQNDAASIKKYMTHDGVSYLKKDFISGLGTTVHECLHGYDNALSSDLVWDENTYPIAYFIDKNLVISFQGMRLFKTEKLHPNFYPLKVKQMFRYGTYVYDNEPAEASSNQWGIYGLLEEFNAYYHDMQSQIEYYNCEFKGRKNEIIFGNEMNAYFEFNIFMGYYLQYAKKYKKAEYEYIVANTQLRKAYTLMEYNWRQLLTEVFSDKDLGLRLPNLSEDALIYSSDLRKVMSDFMLPRNELGDYHDFLNKRKVDMSLVEKNLPWAGSDEVFTLFGHDMEDEEWNSNEVSEVNISMDNNLKEANSYYVTVLVTSDPDKIMKVLMNPQIKKYNDAGIFEDEKSNLHVYLKKFDTKKDAMNLLLKVKNDFPKAKVE